MNRILRTKIFITAIILFTSVAAHAQWINSITLIPANPTPADTLHFYADLSFPSGNCDEHSDITIYSLPYIGVFSLHCLGMLTFICSHTDTFKFDPLPVGNYTFVFHVDIGELPSPCIANGPGATDSISFSVSSASSIPLITNGNHDLLIFPNPAGNTIKLQMSNEILKTINKSLSIYSMEGKEIGNWKLEVSKQENEINISELPGGIYFCKIAAENTVSDNVKLIVIK
jgi:hypothetical protein